jgi:hypothetical protein
MTLMQSAPSAPCPSQQPDAGIRSRAQLSPDRIVEIGYAFRAAKTLLSAVELGVFTALAQGPCDLDKLKAKLGIAERGARDFLDALVALGLLERDGSGRYRNSPDADHYLDADKPSYIGGDLSHNNERGYPHWHSLTAALRTGVPQSKAGACGYFHELHADEAAREAFVQGMTGGTRQAASSLAGQFPWRQYRTMIDIGTAEGCLAVEIAKSHPHITGGGFDLPAVQPHFDRFVGQHGLAHRLRFHAGDFLRDPLPRADVLVLGRVLHNWDLATKMMLLKKTHTALPSGGALIVYERLIDDDRRVNAAALLASLNMLIMTAGGFDFTTADCARWMQDAGFHGVHVGPLTSEISMIVGLK